MRKRGQLLGLPLLLLFGLIVGAFILLYGAKTILDLTSQADYVDFLDTTKDLEATIQTFQNYDPGSSKVYALNLPDGVETLCFYDASQDVSCTEDGQLCSADLSGNFELVADSQFNLYVFPLALYDENRFPIENFVTKGGNPICVSNGGSVVINAGKDAVSVAYYGG